MAHINNVIIIITSDKIVRNCQALIGTDVKTRESNKLFPNDTVLKVKLENLGFHFPYKINVILAETI